MNGSPGPASSGRERTKRMARIGSRRPKRRHVLVLSALLGATAALADDPARVTNPSDLHAATDRLMSEGRNREALPILDALLGAAPGDGAAYEDRGLARWRNLTATADGQDGGFGAIQARMCIETEPSCAAVAAVLSDLGRAIALQAGPARAKALAERARVHLRLGNDALSLADDDEALRLAPEDIRLHEDRAKLREHMGDADGALADLDAALRLHPGAGEDLVMRAELRRRKADVAGARADLDEALAQVPPGPEPGWLESARALRRAVAAPGEPGMSAESGPLTITRVESVDTAARPALSVTFDPASAVRLAAYTAAHVGSAIEIVTGDEIILRPRILSPIAGGVVVISGNETPEAMERLKRTLGAPGAAVSLREAR